MSATSALLLFAAQLALTEVTEELGLDFRHDPAAQGKPLIPEIMGSGAAVLDYDADGHMDFYVTNDGEANKLWKGNGS